MLPARAGTTGNRRRRRRPVLRWHRRGSRLWIGGTIDRKTWRGIEIDPSKNGEVDLYPAMGIVAIHNPCFTLPAEMPLAETIDKTGSHTPQTVHPGHKSAI